MGSRRWMKVVAAALVVTTGVFSLGLTATAANGRGDQLFGDLNGDRITDRATLGVGTVGCIVIVELGEGKGVFGKPVGHVFPHQGRFRQCPDMGVIVDLGGDGTAELVLAFFDGVFDPSTPDLLVLRNYRPAGGFDGIDQPSGIGTADFNGDGRQDLYEWTDQGDGLRTFLNTRDSRLVEGPARVCHFSSVPRFALADFDVDGATDIVSTQTGICPSLDDGVVVVFGRTGRVLALHPGDFTALTPSVVDADKDGIPDVRVADSQTGEVTHYISNGDGTFTVAPTAVRDVATVRPRGKVTIDVLANDAATATARLRIVVKPRYGRAVVTADNQIVYTHRAGHLEPDRLVYEIVDDFKASRAAVRVSVRP